MWTYVYIYIYTYIYIYNVASTIVKAPPPILFVGGGQIRNNKLEIWTLPQGFLIKFWQILSFLIGSDGISIGFWLKTAVLEKVKFLRL